MRHARRGDFLATSRASEKSLLLGKHLWVVHNDSRECSKGDTTSYRTNLTLHACNSQQFACDNAFCIAMEKRCNAKEDCIDGSDEHNCGKLIQRRGYKKELTPLPKSGQAILVTFSLAFVEIKISEDTETFTSRISYTRRWFDGRLMYKNLKNESGSQMNAFLTDRDGKMHGPCGPVNADFWSCC